MRGLARVAWKFHTTDRENNNRRWKSHLFATAYGTKVAVATHPSIADWTNSATDPTGLVLDAPGS